MATVNSDALNVLSKEQADEACRSGREEECDDCGKKYDVAKAENRRKGDVLELIQQNTISSAYGNSSDEQAIIAYSLRESYQSLFRHMLEAVANNACIPKVNAHIALCVKYALCNGCKASLVYNCHKSEDSEGDFSDFYLFRDHTRELTDYLDEKLSWDLSLNNISDDMIKRGVESFISLADTYKFK